MFNIKLSYNWKTIIKEAWSIRFAALAGVFSGAEVLLPMFAEAFPQKLFAIFAFIAAFGGVVSRVIAQRNV